MLSGDFLAKIQALRKLSTEKLLGRKSFLALGHGVQANAEARGRFRKTEAGIPGVSFNHFSCMRDQLFTRHTNPAVRALAVLPLTNLSGDPEQDYFAEGMTEALSCSFGHTSILGALW